MARGHVQAGAELLELGAHPGEAAGADVNNLEDGGSSGLSSEATADGRLTATFTRGGVHVRQIVLETDGSWRDSGPAV